MNVLYELDTPALLVDLEVMDENLRRMQRKADAAGVKLRPHTKTHRCPAIAKRQLEFGAKGIAVAKLGEAEVMAENGIDDIFIANELASSLKMQRLKALYPKVKRLAVGVDNPEHVRLLEEAFKGSSRAIDVMIDVDTGYGRTGVDAKGALELAGMIDKASGLKLRGVYSHDGNSYNVKDLDELKGLARLAQLDLVAVADELRHKGFEVEEVSFGSTPSLLVGEIEEGITEIRIGTYVFMDANQSQILGHYDQCAETVLATVMSRPRANRVVLDVGTKGLSYHHTREGITAAYGFGRLKTAPDIALASLSDEHGSFDIPEGSDLEFNIGDQVEIIPNHTCPATNLYDVINLVKDGRVVGQWPILCRGKSQ